MNTGEPADSADPLPSGQSHTDDVPDQQAVAEEAASLLSNENILAALKSYDADSPAKETAAEYVRSYTQFMNDIVSEDMKRGLQRSDAEIRDLVGNVNMMLKERNEDMFVTILHRCPAHYRSVQKSLSAARKNA
jgi:hypothetical protein